MRSRPECPSRSARSSCPDPSAANGHARARHRASAAPQYGRVRNRPPRVPLHIEGHWRTGGKTERDYRSRLAAPGRSTMFRPKIRPNSGSGRQLSSPGRTSRTPAARWPSPGGPGLGRFLYCFLPNSPGRVVTRRRGSAWNTLSALCALPAICRKAASRSAHGTAPGHQERHGCCSSWLG